MKKRVIVFGDDATELMISIAFEILEYSDIDMTVVDHPSKLGSSLARLIHQTVISTADSHIFSSTTQ